MVKVWLLSICGPHRITITPHHTAYTTLHTNSWPSTAREARQFLAKHSAGGPLTPANPADGYWRRVIQAPGFRHLIFQTLDGCLRDHEGPWLGGAKGGCRLET